MQGQRAGRGPGSPPGQLGGSALCVRSRLQPWAPLVELELRPLLHWLSCTLSQ